MKKLWAEFKKFISRGSVMDLAVGTIIGGAFTAIVTALSNGILKPLINTAIYYCIPGDGLDTMYTFLVKKYTLDDAGVATDVIDLSTSIYIDWGAFISAIINFFLIAIVLFFIIKAFNAARDAQEGLKDMEKKIAYKKEHNIKLTKKEAKFVAEQEEKAKAEAEAAALAAATPKAPTTEELLADILAELKKSN